MGCAERGRSPLGRLSDWFYQRPGFYLLLLLVPPLLWFGVIYIGSLLGLLWLSFSTFVDFTMLVSDTLTLANYVQLLEPANLDIVLRTLGMAIAVTLFSALLAFPIAYYMTSYNFV